MIRRPAVVCTTVDAATSPRAHARMPDLAAAGSMACSAAGSGMGAAPALGTRQILSFRSVNRSGTPGHEPGLQRHHLLPLELLAERCFAHFFDSIVHAHVGFDDFRRNGVLLPGSDGAARLLGLPMHRGPHRFYTQMVVARVGTIEERWALRRAGEPHEAREEALFRLDLLQRALRRRLLDPRGTALALNRRDPALDDERFLQLDAMADLLFGDTG